MRLLGLAIWVVGLWCEFTMSRHVHSRVCIISLHTYKLHPCWDVAMLLVLNEGI